MKAPLWITLCVALILPRAAAGQNNPAFYGLGDLPGGSVASEATAVSTDGSTVVGHSVGGAGTEAVRWTIGGGLQGLGSAPSRANGVSSNGSVIAGTGTNGSGASRAFRRTGGTTTFLGTFTCTLCAGAATGEGISGNGQVVVGSGLEVPVFGSAEVNAARWPNGGTTINDLGDLPGGGQGGQANDATTDGSVIVGEADATAGPTGFYWNGSIHGLPGIPGAAYLTAALAISDDGSTIVGEANTNPSSTNFPEPVRWTGTNYGTIQTLGALPGQSSARGAALDVTPDGALIVGTTRDLGANDVAFLWDVGNGMHSLKQVLEDEYGLDLTGWQLHAANGISQVNGAGEFTVVGEATNPAGNPEGFVAILSPTDCNDGVDGDGDLLVDYPADPQCTSPGDRSEEADCSDGLDNDGNGQTDFPAETDCTSASDLSELPDCGNGFDDDGDGLVDDPADPGCKTAASQSESPACSDGVDNDGDSAIDMADSACLDPSDTSERLDCGDGIDNDRDGLSDYPADPDCTSASDPSEDPACFDFVDNDGDGRKDHPAAYPRCRDTEDATEAPECSDGVDDDGDLATDYPNDPQCPGPLYDVEAPAQLAVGDLLVIDRAQDRLYRIDPVTGAEQILSQGAQLDRPEGLALRADGRVVVSTPSGLLEIGLATGRQDWRSSTGFSSAGALPVAADPSGDLVVEDTVGIHRVAWNPTGTGAKTTLVTLPVGGNPGQLHLFLGYSLLLEDIDTALATGAGTIGDGVFRVELASSSVSKVTPSYLGHLWRDLAAESSSMLVAVGTHNPLGEGVSRINAANGSVTALSTDPAWVQPESVAVGAGGIYVADSGTCDLEGACTGGLIARVDPGTGARTVVKSGIFAGTLQVRVVGAVPVACADGIDTDGDGSTDLADPGCRNALGTVENPACDNGLDDDGDGEIDWDGAGVGAPDPQCGTGWHGTEKSVTCGLGAELVILLPLLASLRRRGRR